MTTIRRTWSFFCTPVWIYLVVMAPICGMAAVWIASNSPAWMRLSAAMVIAFSIHGFLLGYFRRLVITDEGVRFFRLGRPIFLPWGSIRRIGRYVPGGGVGTTEYVYITTAPTPPQGRWDMDDATIQLQDRPGLLQTLQNAQDAYACPILAQPKGM